jgi:hypothetical protein
MALLEIPNYQEEVADEGSYWAKKCYLSASLSIRIKSEKECSASLSTIVSPQRYDE